MTQALRRTASLAVRVAVVLGICTACSGFVYRTAYRSADRLLLLQIDHYFDLDSAQKADVTLRLQHHLQLHKQSEMPKYEAFLINLKSRVEGGLSRGDIEWMYERFRIARIALMTPITPDIADVLVSLSPEQVAYFEKHVDEFNKDIAKTAALPLEDRLKQRDTQLLETVHDWIGAVRPDQEEVILAYAAHMPDFPPAQLTFRRARQKELLQLLKEKPDRKRVEAQLRIWLIHPTGSYPPAYRQAVNQWNTEMQALILGLDATLSPEQRARVLKRLDGYIQDVREMRAP